MHTPAGMAVLPADLSTLAGNGGLSLPYQLSSLCKFPLSKRRKDWGSKLHCERARSRWVRKHLRLSFCACVRAWDEGVRCRSGVQVG